MIAVIRAVYSDIFKYVNILKMHHIYSWEKQNVVLIIIFLQTFKIHLDIIERKELREAFMSKTFSVFFCFS